MPIRKLIRLNPAVYLNGCFFVTVVAAGREKIFIDERKEIAEKVFLEIPSRFSGWKIDTHVVMSDHLHFILCAEGANTHPLGKVVGAYKSLVSYHFRKTQGMSGKIWQHNYFERIIRSEEELGRVRSYILHNPIKEKIPWQIIDSDELWDGYLKRSGGACPAPH